jgi:hypothetical protein
MKTKTSFTPHSAPTAPSRTAMPSGSHSSMTPSTSRAPLTSSTLNQVGDLADDDVDKQVFWSEHTVDYSTMTYVVHQVLIGNVDHSEKPH